MFGANDEQVVTVQLGGGETTIVGEGPCTAFPGGPAAQSCYGTVVDVATTPQGDWFTADYEGSVMHVDPTGAKTTHIGRVDPLGTGPFVNAMLQRPRQLVPTASPDVWYLADGPAVRRLDFAAQRLSSVIGYDGGDPSDGAAARYFASFGEAAGLYFDETSRPSSLYVSDAASHYIYKVDLNDSDDSRLWEVHVYGGTGSAGRRDGDVATASFNLPSALAWDAGTDTLYVADRGSHLIRKIAGGTVTTIAGVANDSRPDADLGSGLPIDEVRFDSPDGLLVEANGNLLVADTGHHRVRRIDFAAGMVFPIIGDGSAIPTGDGPHAKWVSVQEPRGMAIDAFGNLFVAAGPVIWEVFAGADGVATGMDPARVIYGGPPRLDLPKSATTCLSSLALSPNEDQLLTADLCSGFFLRLTRAGAP
jgi:hypothetical protein